MNKITNKDWWFGRTPEQLARRERLKQKDAQLKERQKEQQAKFRAEMASRKKPAWLKKMNSFAILVGLPIVGFVMFSVIGLVAGVALALLINAMRK